MSSATSVCIRTGALALVYRVSQRVFRGRIAENINDSLGRFRRTVSGPLHNMDFVPVSFFGAGLTAARIWYQSIRT